jgi:Autotransporter beta-domain
VTEANSVDNAGTNASRSWSIWTAGTNNWIADTQVGANYSGTISDVLFGADRLITPDVQLGLAAGYKRIGLGTGYNNGTFNGDGFTVIPYATYFFNQTYSLSGQLGYAGMSYVEAHDGTSGNTYGNRLFGKVDFHARAVVNAWDLRGSLAFLYANEVQNGFYEANGTYYSSALVYGGIGQLCPSSEHLRQIGPIWKRGSCASAD